jgi:hypothetical protein
MSPRDRRLLAVLLTAAALSGCGRDVDDARALVRERAVDLGRELAQSAADGQLTDPEVVNGIKYHGGVSWRVDRQPGRVLVFTALSTMAPGPLGSAEVGECFRYTVVFPVDGQKGVEPEESDDCPDELNQEWPTSSPTRSS